MKKKIATLFIIWTILHVGLFITGWIMRGDLFQFEGNHNVGRYFFPFSNQLIVYDFTEMGVYIGLAAIVFYFYQEGLIQN